MIGFKRDGGVWSERKWGCTIQIHWIVALVVLFYLISALRDVSTSVTRLAQALDHVASALSGEGVHPNSLGMGVEEGR